MISAAPLFVRTGGDCRRGALVIEIAPFWIPWNSYDQEMHLFAPLNTFFLGLRIKDPLFGARYYECQLLLLPWQSSYSSASESVASCLHCYHFPGGDDYDDDYEPTDSEVALPRSLPAISSHDLVRYRLMRIVVAPADSWSSRASLVFLKIYDCRRRRCCCCLIPTTMTSRLVLLLED